MSTNFKHNQDVVVNNKRIVKNTLILYLRMLLVLGLNLYISRIVLQVLGVEDYGIYNVVGGVVVLFSYMNSALSLASTRFMSYEMPNGTIALKRVFNTAVVIQLILCVCVLLLAETFGLWFLNQKLVIPDSRMYAANCVFQISIITTILSIIRVPYESAITAHEDMHVYAILSIVEVLLKLLLVFVISSLAYDYLVTYSFGLFLIALVAFVLRVVYCRLQYAEIRLSVMFSKQLFTKMFSFIGWNFFGATAGMCVSQGLSFILNIFFGPVVNAARGIAIQVESAINQFVTSINTAVNPQIVKRYSMEDYKGMYKLVFFSSKISFILLLTISFPIIVDAHYVLSLWLGIVPDNAVVFTRLELLYMLSLTLTYSINMSAQASGKIKLFQIAEGSIMLLNLPCAYILFRLGYPAYTAFVALVCLSILALGVKMYILKKIIGFPVASFLRDVILRVAIITIIAMLLYGVFVMYEVDSILVFIVKCVIEIALLLMIVWSFAMNSDDKAKICAYVVKIYNRLLKK